MKKDKRIKNEDGKRRCPKCKVVFYLNAKNFHRDVRQVHGFNYYCKKCFHSIKRKKQKEKLRKERGVCSTCKQIIRKPHPLKK